MKFAQGSQNVYFFRILSASLRGPSLSSHRDASSLLCGDRRPLPGDLLSCEYLPGDRLGGDRLGGDRRPGDLRGGDRLGEPCLASPLL